MHHLIKSMHNGLREAISNNDGMGGATLSPARPGPHQILNKISNDYRH